MQRRLGRTVDGVDAERHEGEAGRDEEQVRGRAPGRERAEVREEGERQVDRGGQVRGDLVRDGVGDRGRGVRGRREEREGVLDPGGEDHRVDRRVCGEEGCGSARERGEVGDVELGLFR